MDIKQFNKRTYLILFIGIGLFVYGFVRYFYYPSLQATNLSTQLPTVSDGSITLLIGSGLLLVTLYRVFNRSKMIRKQLEFEEKEKQKIRDRYKKLGK